MVPPTRWNGSEKWAARSFTRRREFKPGGSVIHQTASIELAQE
jgi:hypothetical protein